MRFFYDNLIDKSGVVLDATDEDAEFPVENLINVHKTKFYRTGASVATQRVIFDLGSAKAVNSFILFAHNLTASDSAIKIQANTSSSWTSPPVDETLTYSSAAIVKIFSATQTYRYWSLVFTKSAAAQTRQIGRVFLGEYITVKTPLRSGIQDQKVDPSDVSYSSGHNKYSNPRDIYRLFSLNCLSPSEDDKAAYEAMDAVVGVHTPFFVQISALVFPEYLYAYFQQLQVFKRQGSNYYTFNAVLEESI